ncbi:MAG TPA: oligosaccharide flippase family protein, partial [Clostridium sp.]
MSKSRTKLLLENFFIYGLGSCISKIIPLIMLPVITSIMTDSKYYGINDMVNLVISFAGAIAIMGMYDAMFRMFFEKDDEDFKKNICSTALFFVIVSSVVTCLILMLLKAKIMMIVISNTNYNYLFLIIVLNVFFSGILSIVSAPTRMENKRKIFILTNTITPILLYGVSMPMLLKGEFIYALPLAALISTILMSLVFYIMNRKWFFIKFISFKYLKDMLKIGIPLMPTFIMFWLCSSMDRMMIKSIMGLESLGIYSVASKIAQISQLIYTAVAMGWQYFAFSTMNDEDQVELITKVIDYLLGVSVFLTILVATFSSTIFDLLAKGNY